MIHAASSRKVVNGEIATTRWMRWRAAKSSTTAEPSEWPIVHRRGSKSSPEDRAVSPASPARHHSTRECLRWWHSPGTFHNLDSRRAGTRRQNSDTRQESSSNPRQASHFRKTQSTAAPAVARYRVQEYKTRSAFQKAGYRKFLRRWPVTPGRSSGRKAAGDKSSSVA